MQSLVGPQPQKQQLPPYRCEQSAHKASGSFDAISLQCLQCLQCLPCPDNMHTQIIKLIIPTKSLGTYTLHVTTSFPTFQWLSTKWHSKIRATGEDDQYMLHGPAGSVRKESPGILQPLILFSPLERLAIAREEHWLRGPWFYPNTSQLHPMMQEELLLL